MSLSLFSQITFLNLFQNDMLKIWRSKYLNPLYPDGLYVVVKCRFAWTLCTTETSLKKGAGDGKGSASVWDDLLQVVNAELKCLKLSIYCFFFFLRVLYWYSFHLFSISLWFVHPSPNVLSVLVIFHTKIWFSMNSSFKVFNQWEKWVYRTSETLLLKLRHFNKKKVVMAEVSFLSDLQCPYQNSLVDSLFFFVTICKHIFFQVSVVCQTIFILGTFMTVRNNRESTHQASAWSKIHWETKN